jgi:hypothetical protein
VGIPVYRLLCSHNSTSFWYAPVVGCIAGVAATYVICAFMLGLHAALNDREVTAMALKFHGPVGAVIGTIIWLIARPDRQSHDTERGIAANGHSRPS